MRVKFWGVRGSIPTPGPMTVKYGGNTPCIEVILDDGSILILDAGSGIRPLGLNLAKRMPIQSSLFISHTHWDHIQGLPFFLPLFVPGNRIDIYGLVDPVSMGSIRDALSVQLDYRFFPVREAELQAEIHYESLTESSIVQVGNATVTTMLMNHPVLCLGFKIESQGRSLFYTGDHEPYQNIYSPEEPEYDDYQQHITDKKQDMLRRLEGVDMLISDAQYTPEEYETKTGWGALAHARCRAACLRRRR